MSQLTVTKIDRLDALVEYREQYQSLLNSLERAETLYFDLDYMTSLSPCVLVDDASGGNRAFCFLLAFRGQELVGVAPLMREKKKLTRFGVKRIYHFGETNNSLMVSFPQCLALPHEKPDCIAAFVQYLKTHSHNWDIVDLGYLFLPDEIELYKEYVPDCFIERERMKCHATDIRNGFEAYRQTFSPKHRRNFRRSREKLESVHRNVRFIRTARLTQTQRLEIEALHVRRQQTLRQAGIDRDSLFEVPSQKKAFWDCDDALRRKQSLSHYLLYADDRLIAFQLCYRNRGATYFQLIAMDDDFRQYSPAKLLVLYAYEQESKEGVSEINLLLGTNPLKAQFGKQETIHFRVGWESPRVLSRFRIRLWRATQKFKARFGQWRKHNQPPADELPAPGSARMNGTNQAMCEAQSPTTSSSEQSCTPGTVGQSLPRCIVEIESPASKESVMTTGAG